MSVGRQKNNRFLKIPNSLFIAEPSYTCVSPGLGCCSPYWVNTDLLNKNLNKPTVGLEVWLLQGPTERLGNTAQNCGELTLAGALSPGKDRTQERALAGTPLPSSPTLECGGSTWLIWKTCCVTRQKAAFSGEAVYTLVIHHLAHVCFPSCLFPSLWGPRPCGAPSSLRTQTLPHILLYRELR